MVVGSDQEILSTYFQQLSGSHPTTVTPIESHASARRIYRLQSGSTSVVGVLNDNSAENDSFVYLARFFRSAGLPVPEIFLYEKTQGCYLEEDLGELTLLEHLQRTPTASSQDTQRSSSLHLYTVALNYLVEFQIVHGRAVEFSQWYTDSSFAGDAFESDVQLFASRFVTPVLPSFDIHSLDGDFAQIQRYVSEQPGDFFLYRDFQARNIMVRGDTLAFLDFQGARRGPLQYDVASLLYQSSAALSPSERSHLFDHYIERAHAIHPLNESAFRASMSYFILTRMLQVLGIYGVEGLGAGKSYFVRNIPVALNTLKEHLSREPLKGILPRLASCVDALCDQPLP